MASSAGGVHVRPAAQRASSLGCRSDWRFGCPGSIRAALSVFSISEALDGQRLLAALCRDGAVLLRPAASERVASKAAAAYKACSHFFAQPLSQKALHGAGSDVGQLHGYMSYLDDDDGSECFEVKLHHDPRFIWPGGGLRERTESILSLLLHFGRLALDALVSALHLDASHVASLLDLCQPAAAEAAAANGRLDLAGASHTALRIWKYTHGRPGGWHCDNTLLTLAPAGTTVGLECRSPSDGTSYRPEEWMQPDDVLVFAGDALSYLAAGAVPALMHRVEPRGRARLSAPCFLRARRGALLVPPQDARLPPLCVAVLEHNADNVRSQWPWKLPGAPLAAYYSGQVWHPTETAGL